MCFRLVRLVNDRLWSIVWHYIVKSDSFIATFESCTSGRVFDKFLFWEKGLYCVMYHSREYSLKVCGLFLSILILFYVIISHYHTFRCFFTPRSDLFLAVRRKSSWTNFYSLYCDLPMQMRQPISANIRKFLVNFSLF
jgi:hypothetical protein